MRRFIFILALGILVFGATTAFAETATSTPQVEALQKQVQELLEQIQTLQKKISNLESELGVTSTSAPPLSSALPLLTRTLSLGMTGDDVRKLQEYLAQNPDIYPEKMITGYFGPLTERAVQKFQAKHAIVSFGDSVTTGYGVVGPQTRAKFEALRGGREELTPDMGEPAVVRPPVLPSLTAPITPPALSGISVSTTTTTTQATTTPTVSTAQATTSTTTTDVSVSSSTAGGSGAGALSPTPTQTTATASSSTTTATSSTTSTQTNTSTSTTTTTTTTTTQDTAPPSTPTDVTVTLTDSTSLRVSWTASTDNVGVSRYIVRNKAWNSGTVAGTPATSYLIQTALSPGTTYSYTVSAYDAAGNESAQSSPAVSVTTPDTTAPATPSNFSASVSGSTVTLTWTDNSNNELYFGFHRQNSIGHTYTLNAADMNATSITDDNLSPDTYAYTIRAYNSYGSSAWSAPISATIDGVTPTATTTLLTRNNNLASVLEAFRSALNALTTTLKNIQELLR